MQLTSWMRVFCEEEKVGSLVEFSTVEAFANVADPVAFDTDYIQCGIPVGVVWKKGYELAQDVFPTFAWSEENGQWQYLGKCARWSRKALV